MSSPKSVSFKHHISALLSIISNNFVNAAQHVERKERIRVKRLLYLNFPSLTLFISFYKARAKKKLLLMFAQVCCFVFLLVSALMLMEKYNIAMIFLPSSIPFLLHRGHETFFN